MILHGLQVQTGCIAEYAYVNDKQCTACIFDLYAHHVIAITSYIKIQVFIIKSCYSKIRKCEVKDNERYLYI
jgi:hypothetical protein